LVLFEECVEALLKPFIFSLLSFSDFKNIETITPNSVTKLEFHYYNKESKFEIEKMKILFLSLRLEKINSEESIKPDIEAVFS